MNIENLRYEKTLTEHDRFRIILEPSPQKNIDNVRILHPT
ncbi:hypothetical protein DSUL_80091 [Desulfovibrionales bacterium]